MPTYKTIACNLHAGVPDGSIYHYIALRKSNINWSVLLHTDVDQCHCWRNLTYQQSTLMHNVGIFPIVIMAGRISHNINGEPGN